MTPQVTSCTWCHEPFDAEAIRFKLTIHPRCANERAAEYVAQIQHKWHQWAAEEAAGE